MSKIIYAGNSGEFIILPSDADGLVGGTGNDVLCGNTLSNTVLGGQGDDQLWGGLGGNDILAGETGNDLYWWGKTDGNDRISNGIGNGQDGLFLYNMSIYDYRAFNQDGNLVFQVDGNNTLELEGWYNAAADSRIQSFVFADKTAYAWNNGAGATVNLHDTIYENNQIHTLMTLDTGNCILHGGSGNDVIVGGKGDDQLLGDTGDDQLWGGAGGNDTLTDVSGANVFWFGNGDGHDVITNGGTSQDLVKFYDINSVSISRSNNDLVLTTAQNSTLTLRDWYIDNSLKLNKFLFADGSIKCITDSGWQTTGVSKPGFNIEVDYSRYDTAGFFTNHPERRAVVEEACRVWESIIGNDFKDISAGTVIKVVNGNTGVIEEVTLNTGIDDLRLYMGSAVMDNSGTLATARPFTLSNTGNAELDNRYNGETSIQPWVGSISVNVTNENKLYFDNTPNNFYDDVVPTTQYDFLHIVVHEIGHILGFGAGNAGNQYVTTNNGITYFAGPQTKQVYGGPAPLDFASGVHFAQNATMQATMKPFLNSGARILPTSLDKAMLADMGYTIC